MYKDIFIFIFVLFYIYFYFRLEVSIGKIEKQRIIVRIPRRPSNSLQLNFEVISSDRNKKRKRNDEKKRKRQKEK